MQLIMVVHGGSSDTSMLRCWCICHRSFEAQLFECEPSAKKSYSRQVQQSARALVPGTAERLSSRRTSGPPQRRSFGPRPCLRPAQTPPITKQNTSAPWKVFERHASTAGLPGRGRGQPTHVTTTLKGSHNAQRATRLFVHAGTAARRFPGRTQVDPPPTRLNKMADAAPWTPSPAPKSSTQPHEYNMQSLSKNSPPNFFVP
jgi:hypothetical protein